MLNLLLQRIEFAPKRLFGPLLANQITDGCGVINKRWRKALRSPHAVTAAGTRPIS
jgi:hypothetical protein